MFVFISVFKEGNPNKTKQRMGVGGLRLIWKIPEESCEMGTGSEIPFQKLQQSEWPGRKTHLT